ncbi:MAG: NADP-dependent malic enzyme [Microbacteriaceae bacterium]
MSNNPSTPATTTSVRPADAAHLETIFEAHLGGKLSVQTSRPIRDRNDLSIVYTPGVAEVSKAIHKDPSVAETHTWASRLVAVISDGTAVLGLGDIGASASLPVMEGKSALFRNFAGLNSIPLVLNTKDVDEIVETIIRLRPSFGAINLEDISAPRCFEIEARLIEALDIPVMHDDQHGTAVVVLAALLNAAKVAGKELKKLKVVITGAGAAGVACAKLLLEEGIEDIIVVDSQGIVSQSREHLGPIKTVLALSTNPREISGSLDDAMKGADVLVGVSSAQISEETIALMADNSIIFALSNPTPEIHPDIAVKYAKVVATGRSDFPNQINNVLAFPGIFRGALDSHATEITTSMKLRAAHAIASLVSDEERNAEYIIPSPFDDRVVDAVSEAVIQEVQR